MKKSHIGFRTTYENVIGECDIRHRIRQLEIEKMELKIKIGQITEHFYNVPAGMLVEAWQAPT